MVFFEPQKGSPTRKANNSRKKRLLAWKGSRAAKREMEREAAKAAHRPTHEWQCISCGRKNKCPKAKVEHPKQVAASGQAPQATPGVNLDKIIAPPLPTYHLPHQTVTLKPR